MPMPLLTQQTENKEEFDDLELTDREFLILREALMHCAPSFLRRIQLDQVLYVNNDVDVRSLEDKVDRVLAKVRVRLCKEYLSGV
jgi:hypothetical protein